MKRPIPLWLIATLPATMAGHALTYAVSGRTMADGHHGWFAPLLEGALALLIGLSIVMLGGVFLRARIVTHNRLERSALRLWPRLAVVQTVLFLAIERAEGTPFSWIGCATQILVALLAAYLLCLFAGFLDVCASGTDRALRYLERLLSPPLAFCAREPNSPSFILAQAAQSGRSGRAPPRT